MYLSLHVVGAVCMYGETGLQLRCKWFLSTAKYPQHNFVVHHGVTAKLQVTNVL